MSQPPTGLVVDYLGLADQLKHALATYTESGGKGTPRIDTADIVAAMLEKYEVCCQIMHGFDWTKWKIGTPAEQLGLIPPAQKHVLQQEDGKPRFTSAVTDLSRASALCAAHDEATRIRDDIAFFQAVRAALVKPSGEQRHWHSGWVPNEVGFLVRDADICELESAGSLFMAPRNASEGTSCSNPLACAAGFCTKQVTSNLALSNQSPREIWLNLAPIAAPCW